MAGFAIVGFEQDPLFRFSAILAALNEFGQDAARIGVIKHPTLIGQRIVCAKCGDFGAVFKTDEIYRLAKTVKRVPSMTKRGRKFMEQLRLAADDAVYATETSQKRMI